MAAPSPSYGGHEPDPRTNVTDGQTDDYAISIPRFAV